jgi:hypothetical protein
MEPLEQGGLDDVNLPCLPAKEELERLDALLADMLTRTQAELDRLSPAPSLVG